MWRTLNRFGSPHVFYTACGKTIPWLNVLLVATLCYGLYGGLVQAPMDYQQKDAYRIIFVHVPCAWMSLFVWVFMASNAAASLIWRTKISDVLMVESAPAGAVFTFLALATGSLWGKPMWGTYWDWDPRLTTELILLFMYLGFIALQSAIENRQLANRIGALFTMIGLVNIFLVHFSVKLNSLHQGVTVAKAGGPAMTTDMLIPLLCMAIAFKIYFFSNLLMRARCSVLEREKNTRWVRQLVNKQSR